MKNYKLENLSRQTVHSLMTDKKNEIMSTTKNLFAFSICGT